MKVREKTKKLINLVNKIMLDQNNSSAIENKRAFQNES
jgi:hypothetical protein